MGAQTRMVWKEQCWCRAMLPVKCLLQPHGLWSLGLVATRLKTYFLQHPPNTEHAAEVQAENMIWIANIFGMIVDCDY